MAFRNQIAGYRLKQFSLGPFVLLHTLEGFKGFNLKLFLSNLVSELSPNQTYTAYSFANNEEYFSAISNVSGLTELVIPFLSPPNTKWPEFLTNTDDFRFGNLSKMESVDRVNIKTDCFISGECKDHSVPITKKVMESILENLPATSKLHIVYVNELQGQYNDLITLDGHNIFASRCRYYNITKQDSYLSFEVIKGLENERCVNAECLVLFIEKNKLFNH